MSGFDWGSALGAAGGIAGGFLGGQADASALSGYDRLREQLLASIQNQLREAGALQSERFDEARGILEGRNEAVLNDINIAESNLRSSASASRQGVEDRNTRNTASAKSSAARRGLAGSSFLDNLQRGVTADTNRQMTAVNSQLGSRLSGLDMARGQARASLDGGLASLILNQSQNERSLTSEMVNAMLEFQPRAPQLGAAQSMGSAGGSLGGLLGGFFGGGGGGGGELGGIASLLGLLG